MSDQDHGLGDSIKLEAVKEYEIARRMLNLKSLDDVPKELRDALDQVRLCFNRYTPHDHLTPSLVALLCVAGTGGGDPSFILGSLEDLESRIANLEAFVSPPAPVPVKEKLEAEKPSKQKAQS